MKSVRAKTAGILFLLALLAGCQQKMAVQPSYRPDESSSFFADGRADRPLPAGTVARGHLRTDTHLFTGKLSQLTADASFSATIITTGNQSVLAALAVAAADGATYVDTFPFPISRAVLTHGQSRYMIYCVVCHDSLGTSQGKIVERGYTPPPSYHIDRLREAPVGYFFDVITNGYGSMPDYKQQIPPRDRWAIVAYIRALQLSRHCPVDELTDDMRAEWKSGDPSIAVGGPLP